MTTALESQRSRLLLTSMVGEMRFGKSTTLLPNQRMNRGRYELTARNRENPYMFRDAMLKLLLSETLPYAKLIED